MSKTHIGWVVLGRTSRGCWNAWPDTLASTRTIAIERWREPLGEAGWPEYERRQKAGEVKTVKTYYSRPS